MGHEHLVKKIRDPDALRGAPRPRKYGIISCEKQWPCIDAAGVWSS